MTTQFQKERQNMAFCKMCLIELNPGSPLYTLEICPQCMIRKKKEPIRQPRYFNHG